MITGMGFCLPGIDRPVCTAADLWEVASEGRSCLTYDGIYHGSVRITKEELSRRVPGIPGGMADRLGSLGGERGRQEFSAGRSARVV